MKKIGLEIMSLVMAVVLIFIGSLYREIAPFLKVDLSIHEESLLDVGTVVIDRDNQNISFEIFLNNKALELVQSKACIEDYRIEINIRGDQTSHVYFDDVVENYNVTTKQPIVLKGTEEDLELFATTEPLEELAAFLSIAPNSHNTGGMQTVSTIVFKE